MGAVDAAPHIGFDQPVVEGDGMSVAWDRMTAHAVTGGTDVERASFTARGVHFPAEDRQKLLARVVAQHGVAKDLRLAQKTGVVQRVGRTARRDDRRAGD